MLKRKDIIGFEELRAFERRMNTEYVPEVIKQNIEKGIFYTGYKDNAKQFIDRYGAKPLFIFVYDDTGEHILTETKLVFYFRERLLVLEKSTTPTYELSLYESQFRDNYIGAANIANRPKKIGVADDSRVQEWYDYLIDRERKIIEHTLDINAERRELLQATVSRFGNTSQLMQAIEELAELITAINHFMRHKPDALDSLVEEIADVRIMTEQLALIVGEGKVQATEQRKLQKLYELLQTT